MKAIRMFAFLASVLITAILFGALSYGLAVRESPPCAIVDAAP
jgi:hypothetical protein